MTHKLSNVERELIEERCKEIEDVHNRQTLRSILSNLFTHYEKGNWAFYELENKWGYCGDHLESDWGTGPRE